MGGLVDKVVDGLSWVAGRGHCRRGGVVEQSRFWETDATN